MWGLKLTVCLIYDFVDFTIGRVLFMTPFAGEIVGCVLCAAMFGWQGVAYALEGIDMTEQLDGFLPLATIIAIANKPDN